MAAENLIHHTLAGSASGGLGQATDLSFLTRPTPPPQSLSLSLSPPPPLFCLLSLPLSFSVFFALFFSSSFFPTRML